MLPEPVKISVLPVALYGKKIRPFRLLRLPDSKPSAKTTLVYPLPSAELEPTPNASRTTTERASMQLATVVRRRLVFMEALLASAVHAGRTAGKGASRRVWDRPS